METGAPNSQQVCTLDQQESFTEVILSPLGILEKISTATSNRTLTFVKGCFKGLNSGIVGHIQNLACLLFIRNLQRRAHRSGTDQM